MAALLDAPVYLHAAARLFLLGQGAGVHARNIFGAKTEHRLTCYRETTYGTVLTDRDYS